MTISQVQGCGNQHGWKEYVRGTEVLLNTIPKVKFDIVVDEDQVDGLIQVICSAAHNGCGVGGKIFVTPVDDVIRIRTGEHGRGAL